MPSTPYKKHEAVGDSSPRGEEGVNPFLNDTVKPGCYERSKMILMTILLIPLIKLILFIVIFLIIALWVSIVMIGHDQKSNEPMGCLRRTLLFPCRILVRLAMYALGFNWVTVKRHPPSGAKANLIVANHIGMFDSLYFLVYHFPSVAMKADLKHVPILGTILRSVQPLFIERFSTEGKNAAIDTMTARIKNHAWPSLLIFPEGTTSSQKVLTTFKKGAFCAGEPCQPVVITYPFRHFDQAWVPGVDTLDLFYRHLCQFHVPLHIEYLPVYVPNEAEIKNPMLYASNVRAAMAKAAGMSVTYHAAEDAEMLRRASTLAGYAIEHVVPKVDMYHVKKLTNMDNKEMIELLKHFKDSDHRNHGAINFAEFCEAMQLKDDNYSHTLFNILDKDGSGEIDFKEVIVALAMINGEMSREEKIKFAFAVYDTHSTGTLSRDDLAAIIKSVVAEHGDTHSVINPLEDISEEKLDKILKEFAGADHHISFHAFELAVVKYPELLNFVGRAVRSRISRSGSASPRSGSTDSNGSPKREFIP